MATYEDTFGKLLELQRMMGAMRHHHAKESGPLADTTRGRGRVLALLKMRDGLSTRDMADVLDIRVSSLNETIARMEADGLVERRQSEEDGRVMLLFLTEDGHKANQPKLDLPRQLLSDFTDEELQTLDGYLDRMNAKLLSELGEDWQEHEAYTRQQRDEFFRGAEGPEGGRGPRGGRRDDRREGRRDDRRPGRGYGGNRGGYGDHGQRGKGGYQGQGKYQGRGNDHGGRRGEGDGYRGNGYAGRNSTPRS